LSPRFYFLPALLLTQQAFAQGEFFVSADVHASSDPVSVSDMISGWDGGFTPGDYAFADGRTVNGVHINGWQVSVEKRWYYYLSFSEDMSVFYYNMEHDLTSDEQLDLELEVQSFKADGIRFGREFNFSDFKITPSLALYQASEYQFGKLHGVSLAGSGASASATLDYHFDEDKILEYPVSDTQGYGASLDIAVNYQGFDGWNLNLQLNDIANRWLFEDAGFTTGCVNIGSSGGSTCSSSGSASGRSGQRDYYDSIPFTVQASAAMTDYGATFSVFRHERYVRVSAEKMWDTAVGDLGLSLHSTSQIGLHWRSDWHELSLVTDDRRMHHARDLQMQLGFHFRWM